MSFKLMGFTRFSLMTLVTNPKFVGNNPSSCSLASLTERLLGIVYLFFEDIIHTKQQPHRSRTTKIELKIKIPTCIPHKFFCSNISNVPKLEMLSIISIVIDTSMLPNV